MAQKSASVAGCRGGTLGPVMAKPCYGDESPIAALATASGESALALIRCSGTGCVELLSKVFSRPAKLRSAGGNTIVHGWIRRGGESIDEVLIFVYRPPRSYTGEEGADISCHGGTATARALMDVLRAAGFRDSLPGEFSFRAFINGKLDLTRLESVMELVQAKTGEGRRRALGRLSGRLREEIAALRGLLLEILAEAELYLDYDETELSLPGDAGSLPGREKAEGALERLRNLAGTWGRERLYQEGALAVIAGRPNAGKSSLFNALLGEDRSIVTEIPGTTRDWIEAAVSIGGIPLRLTDTAGLRGAGEPEPDRVERIGVQRSRELLEQADLVLYLIDGSRGFQDDDEAFLAKPASRNTPLLLLWNKADIAPLPDPPPGGRAFLSLSAKTGQGLAGLCEAVAGALEGGAGGENGGSASRNGAALGNRRQKELVDRAAAALEEALNLADRGEALELIAPSLREALDALGEITGEVSTAEILETIFSKFCVGK
ncbi:MAG: tRNA uridine-5-carboxymethylaminomethyl(34) synthesis GTPase MnmE [Treponema sp.]|nr:tRNA uridine-5-carboxymethylaminomethyl(34) synthesis GTPase MnmE [Treponema sp.]